jgi:hypothetical protein
MLSTDHSRLLPHGKKRVFTQKAFDFNVFYLKNSSISPQFEVNMVTYLTDLIYVELGRLSHDE